MTLNGINKEELDICGEHGKGGKELEILLNNNPESSANDEIERESKCNLCRNEYIRVIIKDTF